ncbi:phosphate ABC transporter substrate-binding protein PstS [Deinococcus peraridilitoris]|nr:phosphate ABC transporter substrate-binding protein PstS [Deinococcus peraridilitoris]
MKKILALGLTAVTSTAFAVNLTGAGATFPYPLYSKMFNEWNKISSDDVNYQSIGSGGGQRQILERTVDFGATDGPMNDEDLKKASGKILHIPITLGAVVPTYNLPGVNTQLKFTGKVLADIYLGKIRTWNDPAITKLNAGVTLPPLPITVVRRSDGSGTTFVWVDYLSSVSSEWKSKVGTATTVQWPVGIGGKGNEGVAGIVKSTPGAIGYNELVYALQNKIAYGAVQNKAGQFVVASPKTVTEAAGSKVVPADTRVSLVNSAKGYPISSFTWVLVYADQKYGNRTEAQASALKKMLGWMVTDGQKYAEPLDYAGLPGNAATRAKAIIASITYDGKALK